MCRLLQRQKILSNDNFVLNFITKMFKYIDNRFEATHSKISKWSVILNQSLMSVNDDLRKLFWTQTLYIRIMYIHLPFYCYVRTPQFPHIHVSCNSYFLPKCSHCQQLAWNYTYMIYSQYKMQLYTQDLYHYHIIIGIVLLLPSIMNLIFELCRCKYYSNSLHFLGFCTVLPTKKLSLLLNIQYFFQINSFK